MDKSLSKLQEIEDREVRCAGSMGSHRIGHDRVTGHLLFLNSFIHLGGCFRLIPFVPPKVNIERV